ncbi:hypothetical protein TWF225_007277 [Orbilia oligospora]|uniref:Uncharacterized protein n=1 Tax=Orbilia oligospora TaxID=2813651 RepID=A0A7C8K6L9_ORBOL|nr:hypothetical protein TWF751_010446 [Orbilia oligospora]KAF3180415.1 hypothetical protein TWF225_007277 [Orbilia oligospora]KAF3239654.1 hypothetical protein TWF128_011754 [Orbilia oligospora]KAF3255386.1 hypothetical protein TWF217_006562 [Orbilia oligospora]KAF3295691.1 hypothetical protein TWF132_001018 [Orbilia oligospora]
MRRGFVATAVAVLASVSLVLGEEGFPRYQPSFQPPGLRKRYEEILKVELEKRALDSASNPNAIPYTELWFPQKVDHFDPSNNNTFQQRYWISTHFYKPGGPIFVLDGGETSGAGRVEYMQTGIGRYITEYLGGIGIVLEHRYYGKSYVTPNLTVENLKWLNTAQSLKDNAYFAENLWKELPANLSHIRPDTAPFISYGGSYAGAKSAFLQIEYPETYYGSLASSAVTWAGENFWEYNEPVRKVGDPICIAILEETSRRIDTYSKVGGPIWTDFKGLFGVKRLEDRDAANFIFGILGIWQLGNWDKNQRGAKDWDRFCANITEGVNEDYSKPGFPEKVLSSRPDFDLEEGIHNFARWTRASLGSSCGDEDLVKCVGTWDLGGYEGESLSESWKLWTWQVCTEWGYLIPGAPTGFPTLVPRIVDLKYLRRICQNSFKLPPDFVIDTSKVLRYGGFNLTAPRLMYIDGTHDPWLYATPHSINSPQKDRSDRLSILIQEAWHHNDENGLGDISKEPLRIQDVHFREIEVVRDWVQEFHKNKGNTWEPPMKV